MNRMQQAARALHACGFKTLPIKPNSKEPACAHGVKDATLDDAATDAYFEHKGGHGVGISGEGFIIFDFDCHGDVDGQETLLDWERENGELPHTLAQTTPSGGYHLIYRSADEVRPSVNQDLAVDVRAWGSYVVCDPTPGYTWECDPKPSAIADADEKVLAFLDYIRPRKAYSGRVEAPSGSMKEGGRNSSLYAMACSLQGQNWDDLAIRASIETYNRMQCDPPLPQEEVDKLLESALSLPKGMSEEAKAAKERAASLFTRQGKPRPNMFARTLIDTQHACLIDGAPAIWNGQCYEMGWTAIDRAAITLCDSITKQQQSEIRHYISRMAPIVQPAPAHYIAFKNGVYDMSTATMMDPSPELVITNVIPHNWDESAECEAVDKVLEKMACGDIDMQTNLIEVMGVCMYRSAEFGQSAILLGSGSNGKSTYIKMLRALLGVQNVSSLDLSVIGKQFQTGRLLGKLANLGDDISNEFQHGDVLAVFKKVATGERLYTDVKGADGFEFAPYCTMVFSSNEFPRLADYTEGMMRRLFPIEFNAVFKKSDPDYNPRITQDVTSEKACEYMCKLGLYGLSSVMQQNGFSPNSASSRRVEEIERENDTVLAWMLDTDRDADSMDGESIAIQYEAYAEWCKSGGMKSVSRTKFTRSISLRLGLSSSVGWRNNASIRVFSKEEK